MTRAWHHNGFSSIIGQMHSFSGTISSASSATCEAT